MPHQRAKRLIRQNKGILLVAAGVVGLVLLVWVTDYRARQEILNSLNPQVCIYRHYTLLDVAKQQRVLARTTDPARAPLHKSAAASLKNDEFLLKFLHPVPETYNCDRLIDRLTREQP